LQVRGLTRTLWIFGDFEKSTASGSGPAPASGLRLCRHSASLQHFDRYAHPFWEGAVLSRDITLQRTLTPVSGEIKLVADAEETQSAYSNSVRHRRYFSIVAIAYSPLLRWVTRVPSCVAVIPSEPRSCRGPANDERAMHHRILRIWHFFEEK
jgi:hypothetical protein